MAKKHPVAAQADALCRQTVEAAGVDLLETVYVHENGQDILRFIIDRRGGISMTDCEQVTRAINPIIDEHLDHASPYLLEVSSPGLDRPLRTVADLNRHLDEWIEISLYKARGGIKKFTGILLSCDAAGVIEIEEESGGRHTFEAAECGKISRAVRF